MTLSSAQVKSEVSSTQVKSEGAVKGLFAGKVFALALGTAPFETKYALRKKITSNGGVISYLVTAKCDFLITCDKSSSSTLTSEKAATKYGIPVVTPDFVDACLSTGTILAVEQQQSGEGGELREKLEQEFTKGNVLVGETDTSVKNRRGNYTSKLKAWEFLDPNGPKFHQREHDVAKFCCLQGRTLSTGETQFCVLEIHVLTRPQDEENEFRFCVYQHLDSGRNNFPENKNKKSTSSIGSTQRLCRFTDSSTVALQAFEKLHDTLSSPPHSMSKWNLQTPLPPHLGSPHFRSARERWVAVLGQLETPLVELVERVWEAAVGRMDRLLLRPIRPNSAQLDSCEALLLEIRRQLTRNDGESVRRLTEDYFQQLPQHEQRPLDSGKELVRQQELLQLIRDVVAVSEPVVALQQQEEEEEEDDGHMSTAAKYRALNCIVSHLAAGSVEYEAVLERVLKAGAGEASAVRIRNVFALRRPDEEVVFDHKLDNRQILFHASPVSNFVGILSRGLLLPKVIGEEKGSDVLGPGDLGAGIYFSDSPAASLRYCGESGGEGGPRLMLLAQVALGNTLTVGAAGMPQLTAAPDGHDSVRRFARDGQLPGAEYAIYRTEQQRLIYLIELEPEAADVPAPIRKKRPVEKSNDVIKIDVSSTHSNRSVIRDVLEELLAEKDRLNAVAWGLRAEGNKELPVASVHVRVEITDLAAKVVIMQEYSNPSDVTLQAKYVFPLDELSAVCGFEAFINGKHVVGVVREKEVARREFSQAVSQGHGAYLMDEIDKDTFSVSVGNLPPRAKVLIKITYVTELTTEGEKILFRLPGFSARQQHVAPERSHFRRTSDLTEEEEEVVAPGGSESIATYSFQAAVTMPFAIRAITSHTHSILLKKTETMATVRLGAGQQLARELRILIELAEIHVPRMWVERTDGLPEACMLTFFPSFDGGQVDSGTLTVVLDASDSMRGDAFRDAQSLAMLCLHFLSGDWNFNVVLFGSTYDELFPVPRIKSQENLVLAESFVSEAVASLGCTDANQVLRPFYLLPGPHATQNVLLISDGHLNNPGALLSLMSRDLQQTNYSGTRLFTMGVGAESSPCNRHLLRLLAERGSGACEYFDATARWNWAEKVRDQMLRCAQASLSDVKVEWQQLDEGEGGKTAVQAPARLAPMFRGTRQVVYGFVPHCSLATLSGRIGSQRVSTVVSCAELSKSQGRTLHLLTARAVIRDWEAGLLEEDAVRNAARKTASEELIVSLSKQYGLVSSLTSFVAVENRDQNEVETGGSGRPSIKNLVDSENVDKLAYIEFESTDRLKHTIEVVGDNDEPFRDALEDGSNRLKKKMPSSEEIADPLTKRVRTAILSDLVDGRRQNIGQSPPGSEFHRSWLTGLSLPPFLPEIWSLDEPTSPTPSKVAVGAQHERQQLTTRSWTPSETANASFNRKTKQAPGGTLLNETDVFLEKRLESSRDAAEADTSMDTRELPTPQSVGWPFRMTDQQQGQLDRVVQALFNEPTKMGLSSRESVGAPQLTATGRTYPLPPPILPPAFSAGFGSQEVSRKSAAVPAPSATVFSFGGSSRSATRSIPPSAVSTLSFGNSSGNFAGELSATGGAISSLFGQSGPQIPRCSPSITLFGQAVAKRGSGSCGFAPRSSFSGSGVTGFFGSAPPPPRLPAPCTGDPTQLLGVSAFSSAATLGGPPVDLSHRKTLCDNPQSSRATTVASFVMPAQSPLPSGPSFGSISVRGTANSIANEFPGINSYSSVTPSYSPTYLSYSPATPSYSPTSPSFRLSGSTSVPPPVQPRASTFQNYFDAGVHLDSAGRSETSLSLADLCEATEEENVTLPTSLEADLECRGLDTQGGYFCRPSSVRRRFNSSFDDRSKSRSCHNSDDERRNSSDEERRSSVDDEYWHSSDDGNLSDFFARYGREAPRRIEDSSMNKFRSGLPLCTAVIEQLLASSDELLTSNVKVLFKKGIGDNLKASELSDIQDQLASCETQSIDSIVHERNQRRNAILNNQNQLGYFTMECIGAWTKEPQITSRLLKTLEESGIKSLGEMRTSIIQLCATLLVLIRVLLDADITGSSSAEEIRFKLVAFPIDHLVKLIKSLIFARWADKQNRLSCRLLELGSNWEAFVTPFAQRST